MPHRLTQSRFHSLAIAAGALIGFAVLAIVLTIWWLRTIAIQEASENAGALATVLAEQTSRSVQSVDLVLTDLKKELGRLTSASRDAQKTFGSRETYELILDRLSDLSQAERVLLIDQTGYSVNTTVG